jgi:protein required for attachment to host cells
MTTTWILVADGARARLFESAVADGALTEVGCYANPEGRAGARRLTTDRPPTVNESVGPARHAIEPHTTAREKVTDRFAKNLSDVLSRGRCERRYARLILVAPPRFLGALHDHFDKPLRDTVVGEVRRNLTALPAAEIRARLPARLRQ